VDNDLLGYMSSEDKDSVIQILQRTLITQQRFHKTQQEKLVPRILYDDGKKITVDVPNFSRREATEYIQKRHSWWPDELLLELAEKRKGPHFYRENQGDYKNGNRANYLQDEINKWLETEEFKYIQKGYAINNVIDLFSK